jgi:hypothetical protein
MSTRGRAAAAFAVCGALVAAHPVPASAAPKLEEELALTDGRRIELTSPDGRRVFSRSYDPQAKKWTAAELVHTTRGQCSDIALAANRSTVAATLRCSARVPEAGSVALPDDSRAMVTTNLDTWKLMTAPYLGVPQVSPDGRRAVWPGGVRVISWWRDHRFYDEPAANLPEQTARLAIGNNGALTSILEPRGAGCRVDLWVRPAPNGDFRQSHRSEAYPSEAADVAEDKQFADCTLTKFDLGEDGLLAVKLRNRKAVHLFAQDEAGDWAPAAAPETPPAT